MSIGQIREFNVKTGNWLVYIERIEMYFIANKISDDVKLPTLISLMGEESYELLSSLASPKKPSELKYQEVIKLLQNHLQPRPSELAERYRFRQRRQLPGEPIAEYVAELKKLSRYCNFNAVLEDNLRDQFVCGLQSEFIRQRLFAEEDLDYKKAVNLAITLESAERDAGAVQEINSEIKRVSEESFNKLQLRGCAVCGDIQHKKGDCKYIHYQCSYCHQTGHLRRLCLKRLSDTSRTNSINNNYDQNQKPSRGGAMYNKKQGRGARGSRTRYHSPRAHWCQAAGPAEPVDASDNGVGPAQWGQEGQRAQGGIGSRPTEDAEDYSEGEGDEPMYQMSLAKYKPVRITMSVHNTLLDMEVDTGAPLSCISKNTYYSYFNDLTIKPCHMNLSFYDGSTIKPVGYIETNVKYKNVNKTLDLYIFDNGTTSLLGRQWLAELNVEIPKLSVNSINIDKCKKIDILNSIFSRHKSLFDGTLGRYGGGQVSLSVRPGAEPVYCRPRPVPYALRQRVDTELDRMLRTGVIEPVDRSDWATPLVIARKADGDLRLCADYKVTLNRVLMVDRYPVPKIDDLFSNLSGQVWFTKLDLSQAYNQLELDEQSRNYTVINTHRGLFKYKRLVYGLSSSPGIFQKFMINLLKDIPNTLVFYDDILIKNKDLKSHLETIDQVLNILDKNGLKIKRSKCEFLSNEVKYLGYIISKDGIRVDKEKIEPIVSMPRPNNVTELKSFLGMVNFYGKFIKNISSYLSPLYTLLKKGKHFIWSKQHDLAFARIKELLCSTQVLAHYDMSLETCVTCDASAHGVGAILAQRGRDGRERVVVYASRALTTAEKHYSQIDKEALSIVFAIDKFHQYLYGRNFTLRTDHKPLVSIFGHNSGIPSTAASRLQRWAIKLAAYDFKIEYVKTDQNLADVLSRLIKSHKENTVNEEELPEQTYLHFATEALLLDYNSLKRETAADPLLSRVISFIRDGWPPEPEIEGLKPYFNRKSELYMELGCILWGHKVVVPSSCRSRVLNELHDPHMGIVKTKALARSYVWWPGVDEAVEAVCRACTICAAVADAPNVQAPHSWPYPNQPWSRIHLDFLGPISGLTYLIIVDSCSKWIEAINMKNVTSRAVITVLREIFSRFGLPRQVVSDNGTAFSSEEFKTFLKNNGIAQIFSAPYHPASNGAAENAVKICKRVIKKAINQKIHPDTALCRFLLAYRNTEHYTIGESPAKILQGRNLRMRLDILKPDRAIRVQTHQTRSEKAAGGAQRHLKPHENVWYRDYRGPNKWLAGRIEKKLGNSDYTVRTEYGTEVHRHVDQLKHRYEFPSAIERLPDYNRRSRSSLVFPVPCEEKSGGEVDREVAPELAKDSRLDRSYANRKNDIPTQQSQIVIDLTKDEEGLTSPSYVPNGPGDKVHTSSPEQAKPKRIRQPPHRYGID